MPENKIYLIHVNCETCCDYYDMEVIVCDIDDINAKQRAITYFVGKFELRPDKVTITACFDVSEFYTGFFSVISSDSGSK